MPQATSVFAPLQASTTAGATVKVTTVSAANVASSITINGPKEANAILVTHAGTTSAGAAGVYVYVRISAEAPPTATAADVPIGLNQSVVVQNPVPIGVVGIAVKSSASGTVQDVYFTPIETMIHGGT